MQLVTSAVGSCFRIRRWLRLFALVVLGVVLLGFQSLTKSVPDNNFNDFDVFSTTHDVWRCCEDRGNVGPVIPIDHQAAWECASGEYHKVDTRFRRAHLSSSDACDLLLDTYGYDSITFVGDSIMRSFYLGFLSVVSKHNTDGSMPKRALLDLMLGCNGNNATANKSKCCGVRHIVDVHKLKCDEHNEAGEGIPLEISRTNRLDNFGCGGRRKPMNVRYFTAAHPGPWFGSQFPKVIKFLRSLKTDSKHLLIFNMGLHVMGGSESFSRAQVDASLYNATMGSIGSILGKSKAKVDLRWLRFPWRDACLVNERYRNQIHAWNNQGVDRAVCELACNRWPSRHTIRPVDLYRISKSVVGQCGGPKKNNTSSNFYNPEHLPSVNLSQIRAGLEFKPCKPSPKDKTTKEKKSSDCGEDQLEKDFKKKVVAAKVDSLKRKCQASRDYTQYPDIFNEEKDDGLHYNLRVNFEVAQTMLKELMDEHVQL